MPTITESATELHQRMKQAKDVKQQQRLQALYFIVTGHARDRQELAAWLGVHRHGVAAWLVPMLRVAWTTCSATKSRGLLTAAASRRRPSPLQERLQDPHGFAGYAQLRTWLAEQHQVHLSYSGVYAVVRGQLRASPNARGRPMQKNPPP